MKKPVFFLSIAIIAIVLLSGCTEVVCGDGVCEGDEDSYNCEIDCGPPIICGNGSCERGEDANNCPADCEPIGHLSVRVTDSETMMPIQGANVLVTNIYSRPITGGTTDANGVALIRDLKPERYLVTASKAGYETNEPYPIITPGGRQTAEIEIELMPTGEQPTTGNLEITVVDINSGWPVEGIRVDLNRGGYGGLALATRLLVKSISVEPTTARGIVALQVAGTTAQYDEGDEITGLTGAGAFSGQEMSVKVAAVIQTSPTASYQARFELYDQYGNLVDMLTAGTGAYLNQLFLGTGSQEEMFTEGDDVTGLKGTGSYAGQDMTVKVAAVTQPARMAKYQARFELYDQYGNLVDYQTDSAGSYLNRDFVDRNGQFVLATAVYVDNIYIQPTTSRGVVELKITRSETTGSNGKVLFEGLTPGVYTATVPPYYTSEGPATVTVNGGETTTATIEIGATAQCGDGWCTSPEDISSCPVDCNSPGGYYCQEEGNTVIARNGNNPAVSYQDICTDNYSYTNYYCRTQEQAELWGNIIGNTFNVSCPKGKICSGGICRDTEPNTGTLRVYSTIDGATVKLDYRVVGTTPYIDENLLIGKYYVDVYKSGCMGLVGRHITVNAGQTTDFNSPVWCD